MSHDRFLFGPFWPPTWATLEHPVVTQCRLLTRLMRFPPDLSAVRSRPLHRHHRKVTLTMQTTPKAKGLSVLSRDTFLSLIDANACLNTTAHRQPREDVSHTLFILVPPTTLILQTRDGTCHTTQGMSHGSKRYLSAKLYINCT